MGESYSRTFIIATMREETTAANLDPYYLRYHHEHDFSDIELDNIGVIGMICTICDQVSIYPEWIYNGRGITRVKTRGELFGRAFTRAMGLAKTVVK
jgi:hypothetical protein